MGISDGKVAIVTGAGKGIGRAESLALAKEGAAVVLVGRNKEDVVNVAGEIESLGGRALPIDCDVSKRDQVDRAVAAAVEAFGPIDILVNNAQAILNSMLDQVIAWGGALKTLREKQAKRAE